MVAGPELHSWFFCSEIFSVLDLEKRSALAALPVKPAWSGLVILLFALIALALGTVSSEFFLCRLSILLLICGIVVFLAGWEHLAAIPFPLAFLVLMIPSATVVDQITLPLQILASKTASFLLATAGVSAVREAHYLLPTARLEVAEACSGIRSLFSLITLTVIYGYLAETRIRSESVAGVDGDSNGDLSQRFANCSHRPGGGILWASRAPRGCCICFPGG